MATSGDFLLATNGDFLMATDIHLRPTAVRQHKRRDRKANDEWVCCMNR
jgi:hypothetical protein